VILFCLLGGASVEAQPSPENSLFLRGDVNVDGAADISDGVSLLGCLFLGGACPSCPDAADSNDDGELGISDSIFLFSYLFLGGPEPPGQPKNWKGNVHLHTYWAVPHPTQMDTWVYVDPYGVYNQAETGCYDLLKDTSFSRLIAPFFPSFHGLPYEIFRYYWGYYTNMNWKPRTLSFHRQGQQLLVSGSFQPGIPGDWRFQFYRPLDVFEEKANEYFGLGLIARETTVVKTLGGELRYSAIWREIEPGESVDYVGNLTPAQWVDKWEERVVDQGWRVEDHFGYQVGGNERILTMMTDEDPRQMWC
jgi:hypothetical protein